MKIKNHIIISIILTSLFISWIILYPIQKKQLLINKRINEINKLSIQENKVFTKLILLLKELGYKDSLINHLNVLLEKDNKIYKKETLIEQINDFNELNLFREKVFYSINMSAPTMDIYDLSGQLIDINKSILEKQKELYIIYIKN